MSDRKFLFIIFVFAVIAFGTYSTFLGQDTNWDLQNYHFYDPYAALNGRLTLDHNVAGIQTTLNPTLDILTTYPLLRYGTPTVYEFTLGGIQGINFLLLVALFLQIFKQSDFSSVGWRYSFAVLTALLGVTGALSASEIGTTFGDLTLSVLNLAAIFIVLRHTEEWSSRKKFLNTALGGLVIGVSAGLKLTNIIYLVSFLAASFVVYKKRRWRFLAVSGGGAIVGLLISHGWWSSVLWKLYGNPVFPFFNGIFKSPNFPIKNFADSRFFPVGWLQTFFYPFFFSWEKGYSHQVFTSELNFVDFRFPLAYLCLFLLLVGFLVKKNKCLPRFDEKFREITFFVVFIVISYMLWQWQFDVQRYAISIELLLPMFIFLTIYTVYPKKIKYVFIACAIFLLFTTNIPHWRNYKNQKRFFYEARDQFSAEFLNKLDHSAIILGTDPLGWLVSSLNLPNAEWLGRPFNEFDREVALKKLKKRKSYYVITSYSENAIKETKAVLDFYKLGSYPIDRCRNISIYSICKIEQ